MSRAPLTLKGAQRLRAELEQLKSVQRPAVINAIAEARAPGDERGAEVAQGRLVALPHIRLAQHDPHALPDVVLAGARGRQAAFGRHCGHRW